MLLTPHVIALQLPGCGENKMEPNENHLMHIFILSFWIKELCLEFLLFFLSYTGTVPAAAAESEKKNVLKWVISVSVCVKTKSESCCVFMIFPPPLRFVPAELCWSVGHRRQMDIIPTSLLLSLLLILTCGVTVGGGPALWCSIYKHIWNKKKKNYQCTKNTAVVEVFIL